MPATPPDQRLYERTIAAFDNARLPERTLLTPALQRAHDAADEGLNEAGAVTMITAPLGGGKTVLAHVVCLRHPEALLIVPPASGRGGPRAFINVLRHHGCEMPASSDASMLHAMRGLLARRNARSVIVDNAHRLGAGGWAILSALVADGHIERLLLIGLPRLPDILRQHSADLLARCGRHEQISTLSPAEVERYVCERLDGIGLGRSVLTQDAYASLHFASNGVPARVNSLIRCAVRQARARSSAIFFDDGDIERAHSLLYGSAQAALVREGVGVVPPDPRPPTRPAVMHAFDGLAGAWFALLSSLNLH